MVRISQSKSNLYTRQIIEQIFNNKQLTTLEHLHLTTAILSDAQLTEEESQRINQIFDQIQSGNIKVID
jgi:hypothetical protein